MLNISPIGRSCTPEERIEFSELDKVQGPHLGPAFPWLVWHHLRSQVLRAPPFPRRREVQLQAVHMQQGGDRTGSQETQGKTHGWKKLDFIRDYQCKGVASRIPCAMGEPQGTRQLFNSMFPHLQYPEMAQQLYSLSHFPSPKELKLMGFPNWEGHGRSAGLISLEDLAHAHTSFCLGRLSWG